MNASDKMREALIYYREHCTGAEPSISVFHKMLDEALAADDAARGTMQEEFEAWCPYKGSPDPWIVWQAAWQASRAAAPQSVASGALTDIHGVIAAAPTAPTDAQWLEEAMRLARQLANAAYDEGAWPPGDANKFSTAEAALRAHLSTRPQQAAPTESDRRDAERWRETERRYNGTKTSQCALVLDGLGLHGDPAEPLTVAIDAAMSAQAGGKEQGS